MNNQTKILNMIDTLELEMKALYIEIEQRVELKANCDPYNTQYQMREEAVRSLKHLIRHNSPSVEGLIAEHL